MLRAGPGKPPYPFTSGVSEHSLFARRLESVATQRIDVGHAHAAALVGAGSTVPFPPAARALLSICLTRNVIGAADRSPGCTRDYCQTVTAHGQSGGRRGGAIWRKGGTFVEGPGPRRWAE